MSRLPGAEALGNRQDRVEVQERETDWELHCTGFILTRLGMRRMADRPWGSMALS